MSGPDSSNRVIHRRNQVNTLFPAHTYPKPKVSGIFPCLVATVVILGMLACAPNGTPPPSDPDPAEAPAIVYAEDALYPSS